MNEFRRLSCFFLVLLYALMLGCAATPKQEGTGEFIDDAVITTKVKAAIVDDPMLKIFEIKVTTFKGQVQLSGFVSSPAALEHAVDVAGRVDGVKSVTNDMRLK